MKKQTAVPLTSAQLGIWFAHKLDPFSSTYNIGEYIEISGPVAPALFEKALQRVVIETESLCLRFIEGVDGPQQVLGITPEWSMLFVDVSGENDPRTAAEAWMRSDLTQPIELTRGPLFTYALLKAASDRFYWYARYHHIVMDGYGMSLMARRVAKVYTDIYYSKTSEIRPFGSLVTLLEADKAYHCSDQIRHDQKYWFDQLSEIPEPISLSNHPPSKCNTFLRQTYYLKRSSAQQLCGVADQIGVTLPRLFIAATAILLHRLTGATNLILSLPITARDTESRCIPGMLSNVLPLRLAISPNATVAEVACNADRNIREGLEHKNFRTADMRRHVDRVIGGPTMYGPVINIMRFDYDLTFAGNPGEVCNLSLGPVEDLSIVVRPRT